MRKILVLFLISYLTSFGNEVQNDYNNVMKLFRTSSIDKTIEYLEQKELEKNILNLSNKKKQAHYLNDLGYIYYKAKRYNKAIQILNKAKNIDKKRIYIYLNLGDCYFKLKEKKITPLLNQNKMEKNYKEAINLISELNLNKNVPDRICQRLYGNNFLSLINYAYKKEKNREINEGKLENIPVADYLEELKDITFGTGVNSDRYSLEAVLNYELHSVLSLNKIKNINQNNLFILYNKMNRRPDYRQETILIKINDKFKSLGEFNTTEGFIRTFEIDNRIYFLINDELKSKVDDKKHTLYVLKANRLTKVSELKLKYSKYGYHSKYNFVHNKELIKEFDKVLISLKNKKTFSNTLTKSNNNVFKVDIDNDGIMEKVKKKYLKYYTTDIEGMTISINGKNGFFNWDLNPGHSRSPRDIYFTEIDKIIYTIIVTQDFDFYIKRITKDNDEIVEVFNTEFGFYWNLII